MNLRSYQQDLIKSLRSSISQGKKRVLAVLPTGGGKTFTFSFMVKSAFDKGNSILILTDRIELMTQAGGALKEVGLEPIRVEAGKKPYLGGKLYTAMVETLSRRVNNRKDYKHWLGTIDMIIIDEAHKRTFSKLFPCFSPSAKVFGFTATPSRIGKKDQLAETYDDLVVGVEISYLVDNGFLASPKYYGVKADLSGVRMKSGDYDQVQVANRFSENKLYRGVVENWKEKTPNTKTLVFSSSVANSLELLEEFVTHGYDAKHLDATMTAVDRKHILEWFHNTNKGILLNVGILTTGFDEPSVETIILYRATKSLPLYLQMVGRGSRISPGKTEFSILDFGNNILTHGFWHEVRPWELTLKEMKDKPKGEEVLKNCPNCEAFIPVRAVTCVMCGHVDVKEKKEQEFAELQLLNPSELRTKAENKTIEEKAEMAKAGLIKPFWVMHNLSTLEDVEKFVKLMGYSPYWFEYNHQRFWWSSDYVTKRDNGEIKIKI